MSDNLRRELAKIAACGFDTKTKEAIKTMVLTSDQSIEASGVPLRVQKVVKRLVQLEKEGKPKILADSGTLLLLYHCASMLPLTFVGAWGLSIGLIRTEAFCGPVQRTDAMVPGSTFESNGNAKRRSRSKSPVPLPLQSAHEDKEREIQALTHKVENLTQALKNAKNTIRDLKMEISEWDNTFEDRVNDVVCTKEALDGVKEWVLDLNKDDVEHLQKTLQPKWQEDIEMLFNRLYQEKEKEKAKAKAQQAKLQPQPKKRKRRYFG